MSPFHELIFLQGLETLSLRVERHIENAIKVVQYRKQGIKLNTIRLPIGTKNIDDIIEDLEQGFQAIGG